MAANIWICNRRSCQGIRVFIDVRSLPNFNHSVTWRRNNECLCGPTEGQVCNDVMVAYSRPVGQTSFFHRRSTRLAIRLLDYFCAFNQSRPTHTPALYNTNGSSVFTFQKLASIQNQLIMTLMYLTNCLFSTCC